MKTMKYYTGISFLAALLLFSGCGKELDELPTGGSDTESPESPEQTEGELLRLRVSDAGYLDAGTGSRATDSGLSTTFEDGDKIGLFVVNNENEVLYANVLYTKNGEEWTAEQNVRTKGYPVRVFAYYPYVEDAEIVEKINKEAQDASAFFKTYIDDLDITDQSTPELYRQADVMACMAEVKDKDVAREPLTLTMNHLMGLVIVNLPETVTLDVQYYLKGDRGYTWVKRKNGVDANISESYLIGTESTQPFEEDNGYRYLCKPKQGNNISFSGSFITNGVEKRYSVDDGTVLSGFCKTYNISVKPFSPSPVEHILRIGDFYMKDGSIWSFSDVDLVNKSDCAGIVFYTGDLNVANKTHGLVFCLQEQAGVWSNMGKQLQLPGVQGDGFVGYETTQKLISDYSTDYIVQFYKGLRDQSPLSTEKTTGWYIPSVDELVEVCKDLSAMNASQLAMGHYAFIPQNYYLSCGEYDATQMYTVSPYNGSLQLYSKTTLITLRLVLAF